MTLIAFATGPVDYPAKEFKHLGVTAYGLIFHLKTGMAVVTAGDEALAKHLDKTLRWTWLNEQPFGVTPTGRGATMCKNAIVHAVTEFRTR